MRKIQHNTCRVGAWPLALSQLHLQKQRYVFKRTRGNRRPMVRQFKTLSTLCLSCLAAN